MHVGLERSLSNKTESGDVRDRVANTPGARLGFGGADLRELRA